MVQKEVADRLCSPPGSREYGGVTAVMSRVRAISGVRGVARLLLAGAAGRLGGDPARAASAAAW
jgi:hypothetical protein